MLALLSSCALFCPPFSVLQSGKCLKTKAIPGSGIILFVSYLSVITVLHCLWFYIRKQLFSIIQYSSVQSLSRVQLFATSWIVACQVPPSMGFSRWEYWSSLPFPSPGDLPKPETEPKTPANDTLISDFCPPGLWEKRRMLFSATQFVEFITAATGS